MRNYMVEIPSVALDTNCIIALFDPSNPSHTSMRAIRDLHEAGKIDLLVSLKSIDELSARDDQALRFAQSLTKLPNYPIGTWNDLVGTWDSLAGTWDDARRNEAIQKRIHDLAKSGVDIRDRGILIDSIHGKVDFLITNDRSLCDAGPSGRLR